MVLGSLRLRFIVASALSSMLGMAACSAQQEPHGRNYRPLPAMVRLQVTVLKDFNGKPFPNAGVVFHAVRNGKNDGNLEVKTDPDGRANIDVIEQGSHVTLQVIARGYATYATEFDADSDEKAFTIRLQRPRAQISAYEDNDGKAAQVKPGIQEHRVTRPAVPQAPSAPASPQSVTPASPQAVTPASPQSVTPASPQSVTPASPQSVTPTAPLETTPLANTPAGTKGVPAGTAKPQ